MKLRVLAEADREIVEAGLWYDDRSPALGDDFREKVFAALARIASQPHRFAKVEFAKITGDVRRVMLERFPYLIVYQIYAEEVRVLACMHSHRNPAYWVRRVQPPLP